jgi:hypothetical protein
VHHGTIRQALADPVPPPRKQVPLRGYALDRLHDTIMAMLAAEPGLPVREVWERLLDEDDAGVCYATIRDYVMRLGPGIPDWEDDRRPAPAAAHPAPPHHGETAGSYLRRLAAANHLRFSYLRRYLARPEGSYGPIDPGRLAALVGRDLPAIRRALPEIDSCSPGVVR